MGGGSPRKAAPRGSLEARVTVRQSIAVEPGWGPLPEACAPGSIRIPAIGIRRSASMVDPRTWRHSRGVSCRGTPASTSAAVPASSAHLNAPRPVPQQARRYLEVMRQHFRAGNVPAELGDGLLHAVFDARPDPAMAPEVGWRLSGWTCVKLSAKDCRRCGEGARRRPGLGSDTCSRCTQGGAEPGPPHAPQPRRGQRTRDGCHAPEGARLHGVPSAAEGNWTLVRGNEDPY